MMSESGAVVFVSPHLDDVALSCGGTVARAAREGAIAPVVVTIFAAPLDLESDLPQARRFHAVMSFDERGGDAEIRRDEDLAAMAVLGAEAEHLGLADCIYRHLPDGRPAVTTDESVFDGRGALVDESDLVDAVAAALSSVIERRRPARLVVPLALGGHRDHVIVRRAAERAWAGGGRGELWYFEDVPYCLRPAETVNAGIPPTATPRIERLDASDLARRLAAIEEYRSQRHVVWNEPEPLGEAIVRHAFEEGGGGVPAERFWMARR